MPEETTAVALSEPEQPTTEPVEDELVLSDLLIEDVSIDGMCGVY